jgi:hypothetical protein
LFISIILANKIYFFMPAYSRRTVGLFIRENPSTIVGVLQQAYAADGFASQYTRQTKAWATVIPKLQRSFEEVLKLRPEAQDWTVLLEYPLYRLRRRIDVVILVGSLIVVVECKVGAETFTSADRRQTEEYALDLRDFHAESYRRRILPVLWSTDAKSVGGIVGPSKKEQATIVDAVVQVGAEELHCYLTTLPCRDGETPLVGEIWDRSAYRPIPNVIEAATGIFAAHSVRSIANADADNLRLAAARLVALIEQARDERKRYLILLTGVPGSGKTLAGLHVVHSVRVTGLERSGEIVYLSGNTPLVVVLREAVARDEHCRRKAAGERISMGAIRRDMRARIQHINDFLQESLRGSPEKPPHEHVIVFDEAQRAWDEKHGKEKFDRPDSEPAILLDLMSRHDDWCACVCLIGGPGNQLWRRRCIRMGRGAAKNAGKHSKNMARFRSTRCSARGSLGGRVYAGRDAAEPSRLCRTRASTQSSPEKLPVTERQLLGGPRPCRR